MRRRVRSGDRGHDQRIQDWMNEGGMIVWLESSHGVEGEKKRLKSRTAERRSGCYSKYTWGYAASVMGRSTLYGEKIH